MPKSGEIIVLFEENKLKAIRKFTSPGNTSLEQECAALLEKLYQKRVPFAVRTYLGDEDIEPKK